MSFADNQMASSWGNFAAQASADARAEFLRKTYLHLVAAVFAFAGLEYVLLNSSIAQPITQFMLGGRLSWFLVLLAFMGVSTVAQMWAVSSTSRGMQYLGLALYVVAEAIIFLPILLIADTQFPDKNIIPMAGTITLVLFDGLTAIVFVTGADFSFLKGILRFGLIAALVLIGASLLFGFNLGVFFCVAMVAFACGYILYYTSEVLHRFRTDQYVGAALMLFASLALLFWYVLQIVMSNSRR